jgi:hypothetical protein
MLASASPQCRAVRCARLSAPRRTPLRRCAASATTAASAPSPVVILPGLGNAAEDYVALSAALTSSLGAVVRTAQARRKHSPECSRESPR